MKHPLIILSLLALVACSKPVTNTQPSIPADTLLAHIMHAIIDPELSCLDIEDEFYMFIDTMQKHVATIPNEQFRIGVKSMAMDLSGMFLFGDYCTPEEETFFYENLMNRLMEVQETWYTYPDFSTDDTTRFDYPALIQHILLRYGENNTNHVIGLDVYFLRDGRDGLILTLPAEAEYLMNIAFHDESLENIDSTAMFNMFDALDMSQTEDGKTMMAFDQDLIEAMLSHEGMFISYMGNEETENYQDRFHPCHLMLTKFHEQYAQMKAQYTCSLEK